MVGIRLLREQFAFVVSKTALREGTFCGALVIITPITYAALATLPFQDVFTC